MIGIVIVTHGRLAVELLSATEHIVGHQTHVKTICIGPNDDIEQRRNEITAAAERYGVPHGLVAAVIRAESGFNPRAVSRKGAQGLMQLMPTTAASLGVRNSFDPRQNIEGGVRHLRSLIDRFPNNLPFALAAYNAGEKAVL